METNNGIIRISDKNQHVLCQIRFTCPFQWNINCVRDNFSIYIFLNSKLYQFRIESERESKKGPFSDTNILLIHRRWVNGKHYVHTRQKKNTRAEKKVMITMRRRENETSTQKQTQRWNVRLGMAKAKRKNIKYIYLYFYKWPWSTLGLKRWNYFDIFPYIVFGVSPHSPPHTVDSMCAV